MRSIRSTAIAFLSIVALAAFCALPCIAYAEEPASQLAAGSQADDATAAEDVPPSVIYSAHVRKSIWQGEVKDGKNAVRNALIDALKIRLDSKIAGSIQYQVYVKGKGWQKVKSNGKSVGSQGKKYGVEAVRVALTGEISRYYTVSYSVKVKGGSWQDWKADGAVAGDAGKGKVISGLKVQLVERGDPVNESSGLVGIRYRVHMKSGKWQAWQANNGTAGKASGSNRINAFAIALDKGTYSGDVYYRVRLTSGVWKGWKKGGTSTAMSSRVEAVQIKLKGSVASKYDVVYRANVKNVGWQSRVRNGETAGTSGQGLPIRAIRVQLVEKSKRTGWVGSDTTWQYYKKGKPVTSAWIDTKESPIEMTIGTSAGTHRYWIDSTGFLAVDRMINPNKARDAEAGYKAYATISGYVMTDETRMIDKVWYTADSQGELTEEHGTQAYHIAQYVQWALDIANDNSHGYSQAVRWGPDYDCSSLVVAALKNTGFQVGDAVYTGNMKSELTKYGFRWYTDFSKLKRGDILLVHSSARQHTEIYIGEGRTVGAHIAETGGVYGVAGDQTGNEISVGPYYSIWQGYLRYVG